jgi:hypothetical protein
MRVLSAILAFAVGSLAQTASPRMAPDDAVRVREFYRLAARIQDRIWPHWSETPSPLILVTPETEFLTHYPAPPKDFRKIDDDLYARPRQFSPELQATFPPFGPPSVIVVGQPKNTLSKTSTPWLITLMHEHFHQLQHGQPGYFEGTQALGLSHGPEDSMWVLNYPFPYEKPEVVQGFAQLRDLLLSAVTETNGARFSRLARQYVEARKKFFAQLSPNDRKYLDFQLWQEGIARYTEIQAAETAAKYQPTAEFSALSDFEPFSEYAARARNKTLDQLKRIDIAKSKREVVYSFGAAEGFLLDRLNPNWRGEYFKRPFSLDTFFEE